MAAFIWGFIISSIIWAIYSAFIGCRSTYKGPETKVVCVKIPSTWRDGLEQTISGKAEFRVGIGPCGKTVTLLRCGWEQGGLVFVLYQGHSDGTGKTFYYRREDITGRIEKEYGLANEEN